MTVHQLFATHCTFGSSALERHNEELADVVFGYSARAGSLDPASLRTAYLRLEPCMHYYLPADTPPADRLRLSAESAPRRLVFLAGPDGLQVAGQVCYRTADCEGRPGAYFAHFAFHDAAQGATRWTALDVLKLWDAPGWQMHDRRDLPHDLPPLAGLAELLGGRRPAIDDPVLWSFLTTPIGSTFDDPGEVIPPRWRSADPLQRQAVFIDLLDAALQVLRGNARSLLVVAEPSVAALFFYGIARLLPPGALRAAISFSTFEGPGEPALTNLAATWFHAPTKSDLPAEVYRGRCAVLNTVNGRRSEAVANPGIYAQRMVIGLVEHGWAWLDRTQARFQAAGAASADDLEQLAELQRAAADLLTPHQPPPEPGWRENPAAARFLQHSVAAELAEMGPPAAALRPIVGSPAHLVLVELLAAEPLTPITRPALEFLLAELPAEQLGPLLQLKEVDRTCRAEALARELAARRRWPDGMEAVWEEASRCRPEPAARAATVLAMALARVDPAVQSALWPPPDPHTGPLLASLWEASRRDARGLVAVVAKLPDGALLELHEQVGPELFHAWPSGEGTLAARLAAMLRSLDEHPQEFPRRLDFLLAGRGCLGDPSHASRLDAWETFRQMVLRIGVLQEQARSALRPVPAADLESACRSLAEAMAAALPPSILPDDASGVQKLEKTRRMARQVLAGGSLLPPGVWQYEALWEKIGWFFRAGVWPTTSLRRMRPGSRPASARRAAVLVAIVLAAVVVVWGLLDWQRRPTNRTAEPSEVAQRPDAPADTALPVAPAATEEEVVRPSSESEAAPAEPVVPSNDPLPAVAPAAEPIPEPVPVGDEPPAALPNTADREAQWSERAQEFAKEHDGLVIETPFPEGRIRILLSMLQGRIADPEPLVLPAAWLELDDAAYALGAFSASPTPNRTLTSPALAAEAGLLTARLVLRSDADALEIALEGLPRNVEEAGDPATRVQRRRAQIESLLRTWERGGAEEAERTRVRDELARLVQVELPPATPKPEADDPRYAADPDAYLAALAAYNDAQHALLIQQRRLAPAARKELDRLDELMRGQPDAARLANALPQEDPPELEALRDRCRRLLLVVYAPASQPAPVVEKPAEQPKLGPGDIAPPAVATMPSPQPADAVPALEGTFTIQTAPMRRPSTLTLAQVKPLVYLPNGRLLSEGYARERRLRIACSIEERKDDGSTRAILVEDVHVQGPQDLFPKATSLTCRFAFFQREFVGSTERKVAESAQYAIQPVKADQLYTVKFQFSTAGFAELERLTSGL